MAEHSVEVRGREERRVVGCVRAALPGEGQPRPEGRVLGGGHGFEAVVDGVVPELGERLGEGFGAGAGEAEGEDAEGAVAGAMA